MVKNLIKIISILALVTTNYVSAIDDTVDATSTNNNDKTVISTTTIINTTPANNSAIATTTIKYNCSNEKILTEKSQYYKDVINKQSKDVSSLNNILDKLSSSTDSKLIISVLLENKIKLNDLYNELQSNQNDFIEIASTTLPISCVTKKSTKNYNLLQ
ncbi:MAG: hypothetical protein QM532_01900, partial [Cyanobium sp. MAG06]|nr:hypothetical protein [Cyanobium sp. MAG06]